MICWRRSSCILRTTRFEICSDLNLIDLMNLIYFYFVLFCDKAAGDRVGWNGMGALAGSGRSGMEGALELGRLYILYTHTYLLTRLSQAYGYLILYLYLLSLFH